MYKLIATSFLFLFTVTSTWSQTKDDRAELAGAVNTTRIAQHPTIFPFLHALSTGEAGGVAANEKRKASTWAGRALLEAGLIRMCENGLMKL